MNHPSEEELVNFFYDAAKDPVIAAHLEGCPRCAKAYQGLAGFLEELPDVPIPEPMPGWTDTVWKGVEPRLTSSFELSSIMGTWRRGLAVAATLVVVVGGAFLAGLFWDSESGDVVARSAPEQRMLALVLEDHLSRSQVWLVEVAHFDDPSGESLGTLQGDARLLLSLNRIYRRAARESGAEGAEQVLDSLERVFLQIANVPPELPEADFRLLVARLDTRDLLVRLQIARRRLSTLPSPPIYGANQEKS